MPRETTFTKAMVVEAATRLVAGSGIQALSARNVAAQLGASTAPIYASVGSIEALREAVIESATAQLRAYTQKPWSERPFLNEGAGLVVFAREQPRLFALLFLTPEIAAESVPKVYAHLLADMTSEPRFSKLTAKERDAVLERMWFVALGMATLAYSGQLRNATTHGIVTELLEAGLVLIPDAVARVRGRKP
jgi:AcrR family transcriptional regulator